MIKFIFLLIMFLMLFVMAQTGLCVGDYDPFMVIAIDISKSNKDNFAQLKSSVIDIIKKVPKCCNVQIITFNNDIKILHTYTQDKDALIKKIISISPSGYTNFYRALFASCVSLSEVGDDFVPTLRRYLIVLTDGYHELGKNKDKVNLNHVKKMVASVKKLELIIIGTGQKNNSKELVEIVEEADNGCYKFFNSYPEALDFILEKFTILDGFCD